MKAAVHIGTCQLCGRLQKLPGGRLSKHGYTVEWHMFSGTCPGADGLPFEQSTDLIEAAIGRAKATVVGLNAAANELETNTDPQTVWIHEYKPPTWENKRGGYMWVAVPVTEITVTPSAHNPDYVMPTYQSKRTGRVERITDTGSPTIAAVRLIEMYRALNARYATSLRREIVEYERYIDWQTGRVAGWVPRELKPA